METYEKLGSFYLGQAVDVERRTLLSDLVLYDAKDLTTHAVIVGMTGSGKTGLGVALLEEALIDGVPVIAIDPKGDLTNLALTFPAMRAEDLQPWVDPGEAMAKGLTPEAFAAAEARKWTEGLAQWGQGLDRIGRLKDAADLTIFTPGSSAGAGVSLLRHFNAPPASVRNDPDLLNERLETTASSLIALLDLDADPLTSRDHILVANIFSQAWQEDRGLDLAGLIQAVRQPPFQRVGIMDLESFYPARERFALAMRVNNLLASPGFDAWLEGTPLDIPELLYTSSGRPRASVFTISHLSDAQRMFFVSMLLNELLGWMRTQPGTASLRALLYMDEIFGYFPPLGNPPSKTPLLRLLKQARAFGLGVVLATQNPVDLDYRGLSNTGTWIIGRLQTERDRMRVLDALRGGPAGGRMEGMRLGPILSSLESRTFLLHNVHADEPVVFKSRWALSYLRGPLTRAQIQKLGYRRVDAGELSKSPPPGAALSPAAEDRRTPPPLPPDIQSYIVRGSGAGRTMVCEPHVMGRMTVYYRSARHQVDLTRTITLAAPLEDGPVPVDWEAAVALRAADIVTEAIADAVYGTLPPAALKAASYRKWQKDLENWVRAHRPVVLLLCPALKLTSAPEEREGDFRSRIALALHEKRDLEVEKLRRKYAGRYQTLKDRLLAAEQAIAREEAQVQTRQVDTVVSFGTAILGAFLGRRAASARSTSRMGTALKSAGRMRQEKMDVERARERADDVRQQMAALEARLQADIDGLTVRFDPRDEPLEEIRVAPKSSDIATELFGLAWLPFRRNDHGRYVPDWSGAD